MDAVEISNGYSWDRDFPPVYNHTSVSYLKRCPGFDAAKHGNLRAALFVANISVKPQRIEELRARYPAAILLPVGSKNRLPEAFARRIGLKVHLGVREVHTLTRKELCAMERLLHKPKFHGSILKGENYILVDDIVTQGGSVAALRQFVLSEGGSVAAVAALAYSAGSGVIAPVPERVRQLCERFDCSRIDAILRSYYIADDIWDMTNSQIKYLLRFSSAERLVKKIEEFVR